MSKTPDRHGKRALGQKVNRPGPAFTATADYVRASGKWLADRDEDAMKYEHVEEINCFKKANYVEAYAWISDGKLDVGLRYYEIKRWDRFGLEAQNTTSPCITSRIVINFGDKSVKALDAPKPASMIPAPTGCRKKWSWTTPNRSPWSPHRNSVQNFRVWHGVLSGTVRSATSAVYGNAYIQTSCPVLRQCRVALRVLRHDQQAPIGL